MIFRNCLWNAATDLLFSQSSVKVQLKILPLFLQCLYSRWVYSCLLYLVLYSFYVEPLFIFVDIALFCLIFKTFLFVCCWFWRCPFPSERQARLEAVREIFLAAYSSTVGLRSSAPSPSGAISGLLEQFARGVGLRGTNVIVWRGSLHSAFSTSRIGCTVLLLQLCAHRNQNKTEWNTETCICLNLWSAPQCDTQTQVSFTKDQTQNLIRLFDFMTLQSQASCTSIQQFRCQTPCWLSPTHRSLNHWNQEHDAVLVGFVWIRTEPLWVQRICGFCV